MEIPTQLVIDVLNVLLQMIFGALNYILGWFGLAIGEVEVTLVNAV